jgi:hypothetical protein
MQKGDCCIDFSCRSLIAFVLHCTLYHRLSPTRVSNDQLEYMPIHIFDKYTDLYCTIDGTIRST